MGRLLDVIPSKARDLHLRNLLAELLWLGGGAAFAYFFLKTFLAIQLFALLVTLTLRLVERSLTRA